MRRRWLSLRSAAGRPAACLSHCLAPLRASRRLLWAAALSAALLGYQLSGVVIYPSLLPPEHLEPSARAIDIVVARPPRATAGPRRAASPRVPP